MLKNAILTSAALGVLALAGCAGSVKEDAQVPSLCDSGEKTVFNCQVTPDNKLLSVCASPDFSKDKGYLQYRYGNVGNPEFSFPAALNDTQKAFVFSRAGGNDLSLSFKNGSVGYKVYSQAVANGTVAGATVLWPGKPQKDLLCGAHLVNRLGELEGMVPAGLQP